MKNVGLIITARVGSKRLPQKVLRKINGRRTIDILIDHCLPSDDAYAVVLAIPDLQEDDILEEIGNERGLIVYRGENKSPLHRIHEAAILYEFDTVIRITSDDILIDQSLLRNQLKFHINGGHDYTYIGRCPEGIAGEVINVDALRRVVEKVGNKNIEFPGYHFKTRDFYWKEFYPPSPGKEYQFSFRLTMDYEEDLILLKVIHSCLREPFGTLDIINFLKQNRYLLNINKLPEVTVYTCNYNTGDYIVDCMKSVVNQTFQDFEYIVVDDCSTDDSMNKIAEYYSTLNREQQTKVKVLRNEENKGLPSNCNMVLDIARGKYIFRLDSDDVLASGGIERMLETAKLENSHGVLSGYYNTKPGLSVTSETLDNEWHPAGCLLSTWCVNELKYKDDLDYLEGREFFDRFNKQYNISFIPEPLWYYRQRPGQKTASPDHPDNGGNND